ncbi:YnfA family protein [Agrobacterium genomosp. 3]|uniref:YnfA family protein n=1 Tax=Agrobacterium tomkonis TaxID=1183410 RepID=UPI001CD8E19B|nr:YnfA family protein [Agrobacterium tomkonis]MCA1879673.1 YnfA family protein [Agrobacterium tumefaciens]MCA1894872.1 YnfA family protein [Agrobacterium tomkonis]
MQVYFTTTLIFIAAAITEIVGCFAFWAWLRMGKSIWWLAPGCLALIGFAYLLTLVPSENAGRAYAAYGGVYIMASLLWLWLAEGHQPDRWDMTGGGLAVVAAAIIIFAPRSVVP